MTGLLECEQDAVMSYLLVGFLAESDYRQQNDFVGASGDYEGVDGMIRAICFSGPERDLYLKCLFWRADFLMSRSSSRRAVRALVRALLEREALTERQAEPIIERAWREVAAARRRRGP